MGHTSQVILELKNMGLGPGSRICDCGSQDFAASQMPYVNEILKTHYGLEPFPEDRITPARDVFLRIGYDYTCVDVDRRDGTVYVDFHSGRFPRDLYGTFDVTMNAGTSEHLVTPLSLMVFMHQTTKAGGIMWHQVPVFGWANHGLNNLTPKFWHQLAAYNRYQILEGRIIPTETSPAVMGNFYGEHLNWISNLRDHEQNSALIQVSYRKPHDYCFLPPFDLEVNPDDQSAELLFRGALAPFVDAGSLTTAEVDASIAVHFGRPPPPVATVPETASSGRTLIDRILRRT
jgi:hypothetical protein